MALTLKVETSCLPPHAPPPPPPRVAGKLPCERGGKTCLPLTGCWLNPGQRKKSLTNLVPRVRKFNQLANQNRWTLTNQSGRWPLQNHQNHIGVYVGEAGKSLVWLEGWLQHREGRTKSEMTDGAESFNSQENGEEPERLARERPDKSVSVCSPRWTCGVSSG